MKFPWYDRWLLSRKAGINDYKEVNRLLIKAGRRTAYDLLHAAASLTRQGKFDLSEYYYNRAHMWLGIFNPLDDGIDYRDDLHIEIANLRSKIDNYRKFIKEHNLPEPDFDPTFQGEDIPF